jgi:hypothetical protein
MFNVSKLPLYINRPKNRRPRRCLAPLLSPKVPAPTCLGPPVRHEPCSGSLISLTQSMGCAASTGPRHAQDLPASTEKEPSAIKTPTKPMASPTEVPAVDLAAPTDLVDPSVLPMQGDESALLPSRTPSSAWQKNNWGPSSSSNTYADYLTFLEDWRKQTEAKKAFTPRPSR